MTDTEFYKSFHFNLFRNNRYRWTDQMTDAGCPRHFIARMVEGRAKICTADGVLHLSKGDVFYIPKFLRYQSFWYPIEGQVTFYSFGFDFFPMREPRKFALQKINCDSVALGVLTKLENDLSISATSIGYLYQFLGSVSSGMRLSSEERRNYVVDKALEYMRENYDYTVGDVARYCGVSESGLYAKFKKVLGRTPIDVRHAILVEKAAYMLISTDLSVEEISARLRFSSSSYFRKIFFAQIGKTPTQFRKKENRI